MQRRRGKGGLAPFLLVLATISFISCAVGFLMLSLPSTRGFMAQLRLQAENAEYPTFLAPGDKELELTAGMIWVSYFTDAEFQGARYQVPASLLFDITIQDAQGNFLPVEIDPTRRANLPGEEGDGGRVAVLLGIVEIPENARYTITLSQPDNQPNKAVAQVITMSKEEKEKTATVLLYLGLGVCGGAGTVFFGVLGLGAVWVNRRFEKSTNDISPIQG